MPDPDETVDGLPARGSVFTGFDDVDEIGRGGFGVVYRATDIALQRTVAIKLMSTALDDNALERFRREARSMAALSSHPNVTPIYSNGATDDGRPFLVMPYLAAGSLRQRLDRGPISWADAVHIGIRIAGALESAHRSGIVHRDIKPDNILVSDFGEPMLADFGISRLTGGFETTSPRITASVAYAAPEVLDGQPPTAASDIYSLGATLYHLIAGTAAFVTDDDVALVALYRRIAIEPVPDLPPDVPVAVGVAIRHAMAKRPGDRCATAAELGDELRAAQQASGIAQTTMAVRTIELPTALADAPAFTPTHPAPGRPRVVAALITVVVLAVAAGIVWGVHRHGETAASTTTSNTAAPPLDVTPGGVPLVLAADPNDVSVHIAAGSTVTVQVAATAGERVVGQVTTTHAPRDPVPVALLFNDSPAENKNLSGLSVAIDPVELTSTGTWVVQLGPATTAFDGSLRIGLAPPDVHVAATIGGSVTVDLGQPRQTALVSFHATAGQRVVVQWTWADGGSLSASIDLLAPDSTTIVGPFGAPGRSPVFTLLTSGTYTLRAAIDGDGTGAATVEIRAA